MLHKSPVKHRFIAGSSKCTTKKLSSLLTKILTAIKTGLENIVVLRPAILELIIRGYLKILSSLGHLGVHRATSI